MNQIFFLSPLPWWAVLVIGFGVLALLFFQLRSLRERLSPAKSWTLIVLRGLVYGVLLFFLLSPGLIAQQTIKLRRSLTVVVDASQSMGLPASPGPAQIPNSRPTRIDLVKEKLLAGKEPLLRRLARDYELRLYQFSTDLETTTAQSIPQLKAEGRGTRLWEAVREASRRAGPGSAILLFSDGITDREATPTAEAPSLPVPVFAVGVGETRGYTDLRIADLNIPDFAFRGREVKFEFSVRAHGLAGKTVPLYFNHGKSLIASRSITIDRDPFETRLSLSYTPREIGPHSFTLSIPVQPGEAIAQNNQREFKVDVQRDKIRVLTLSGSPSWNYRFLRLALKQDPSIDLVSFVFLRTPTDSVDVPDNHLSLIPFPIDEIFLEELRNFDVLVLDDFSHRSYFNIVYLEKVRDFVRDGGGLAMLGGTRSFDSGGYAESPLGEVLPVEMDGKSSYEIGTEMRAVLAPAGKAHPVTRLRADTEGNEQAWKQLPALTTLNRVRRVRGETLLLANANGGRGGAPLLAVGRFGKGRSLAFMSDDLWRWNFIAVGGKESPQHHLKLVRQGVRWLAQEPAFEQVQIGSIGGARKPGEKMDFKIRVFKDDFTPASNATVRLRVVGPDGEEFPLEATAEPSEGEFTALFTPAKEGSYRIEAEARLAGRLLGKTSKNFSVAFAFEEGSDGRPRPELLEQIATASGGEFIPISAWNEKSLEAMATRLEKIAPSEIVERHQIQVWNTLWGFFLILTLLGSEWWLRRKWGLI
ncbi:MAG: hypothetical protein HYV04_16475 [Deltaproteobacteria bacterium]|nr:hypothetical protein [Deltaproteobacteria bacterium]